MNDFRPGGIQHAGERANPVRAIQPRHREAVVGPGAQHDLEVVPQAQEDPLAVLAALPAAAQFQKPEDAVKYRQSAMFVMANHFGRIGAMVAGRAPYDAAAAAAGGRADGGRRPRPGLGALLLAADHRDQHGGDAFAFLGGGGQGNHLGGAYGGGQLRAAMRSRNNYNSLGQEKTGDFWLNGRLFGSQTCQIGRAHV